MECYKRKRRIQMKEFLVGDSIAPIDDIDDEDEEVVSSQFTTGEGIENINMENRGNANSYISLAYLHTKCCVVCLCILKLRIFL